MEIFNIPVGELKPYDKNAKLHDRRQIDNVAESIRQFCFKQPIVIDENNEILAGHTRYKALKELGLDIVKNDKIRWTELDKYNRTQKVGYIKRATLCV